MINISDELSEWLSNTIADSEPGARSELHFFPNDALADEYLAAIDDRPETEVRAVVRALLIPSCSFGQDKINYDVHRKLSHSTDERLKDLYNNLQESDYHKRITNYYSGRTNQLPWEGITWVVDLLPDNPRDALAALVAYMRAHFGHMPDRVIEAIWDAEAIIRAKYIGLPSLAEAKLTYFRELNSRQFEQLIEHLYDAMGYETELTPPRRDGGRDVIARRNTPGHRENLLIECKWRAGDKVGVRLCRELLGIVSAEGANKGVLVSTSDFTRGAIAFASANPRLELVSGIQLVTLLNEYLGSRWPSHLEHLANQRPLSVKRKQDAETELNT